MATKEADLFLAVENGEIEIVEKLLKRGLFSRPPNLKTLNDFGASVLHIAAIHEHTNILRKLLASGSDIDALDGDGRTALHYAAIKRNLEMTRWLLQKRADASIQDQSGQTPLDYARQYKFQDIEALILKMHP